MQQMIQSGVRKEAKNKNKNKQINMENRRAAMEQINDVQNISVEIGG